MLPGKAPTVGAEDTVGVWLEVDVAVGACGAPVGGAVTDTGGLEVAAETGVFDAAAKGWPGVD